MQDISERHKAALAYAAAGIPVFPVEVNGKRPLEGSNGYKDATTDTGRINEWWGTADYNVAFSPGDCGLLVVDLDPGAVCNKNLKTTYRVKTPRGEHHYFSGEGPTTASKLGPHIDTRGTGGYVLLPPSTVGGDTYQVIDDCDYAPLPDWIAAALGKPNEAVAASVEETDLPGNVARARNLLAQYVDRGDVAVAGQGGDERTYKLCCELLDLGLSTNTAGDLLNEIWNPHCQPPWSSDEVDAKLVNAESYRQNAVGAYGVEPSQAVFAAAVTALPQRAETKSRFYFKDEAEQDLEPDPKWVVKDLMTERSTVLMFGPTQSYKSFLALDVALAISTGTSSFGSETLPGLVFYAALEGRAHLRKARHSWRIARGLEGKLKNFYVGLAPMIGVADEIQEFGDEIKRRCQGVLPRLIIIDTLSKSMAGLNENDAADAGKFIRFCDSLVEAFECTVLTIHHTGKDQARGARGSSAFHAGFDTVLEVQAHRASKAVSVHVRKHKDAEERDQPFTFEGRVVGPSLAFFPTDADAHRLLTGDPQELSPKKIGAALQKLNAYGEEHGVSTTVLATELTPVKENEGAEIALERINRTGRALTVAAKNALEAYCIKCGRHLSWCLPAPL